MKARSDRGNPQLVTAGVAEAVAADVMAGLSITAVRGAPGVARSAVLAVVAARLRARGLSVVVLIGKAADTPTAIATALRGSGAGGASALADLHIEPRSDQLGRLLSHPLSLPDMQELVLLVDDADGMPADAYRFVNLLLRLTRDGTARVRFVLFGNAPWPELHRVRQNLWSTYMISAPDDAAESAVAAPRTGPRQGTIRSAIWGFSGLSAVVLCAGAVILLGRNDQLRVHPLTGPPQSPPPAPASMIEAFALPSAVLPDPPRFAGRLSQDRSEPTTAALPNSDPTPLPDIRPPPTRGLVFKAGRGDTLAALYSRFYRGGPMPPFSEVLAINPDPIRPGSLVVFPQPPGGWPSNGSGLHQGEISTVH